MKNFTLFLLLAISVLACHHQSEPQDSQREQLSYNTTTKSSSINQEATKEKDKSSRKKIIRSATARFEVTDVISAIDEINGIVDRYDGYISTQNMTQSDGKQNASIEMRVPSDTLDGVLSELSALAVHMDYMKVNSKDVSEDYVDLVSRLKTKKEVHQRYIDILRNKAGTIEELLSAERRIGILQEEIEAAKGKMRYYDDKLRMSSISIEIYKKEILVAKAESRFVPFWSSAEDELVGGWNMLMRIVILFLGMWPLIIFGSIGYVVVKKVKVRR